MKAKTVFGIDLGTTYSCIARVDEHGKPEIIPNAENQNVTPSIVYFESAENIAVGESALEEAAFHPELVVSGVKRNMGREGAEFSFHGETYLPQQVSAFILKKLATDAEQIVGEPVEDVVITCPAYFGVEQKEATFQAGKIAGLNVLYVIPEPTAAAVAYGLEQEDDQVILVFDLGGGTFDITLIEIKSGGITVISTGGDDQLGGKDWDGRVVEYLADEFERETGMPSADLLDDPETLLNLMTDAEAAKRALGSKDRVLKVVKHGAERVKVELTRERFDEVTAAELERTIGFTEAMIETAAEKGFERIDKLLLVGGSSYMPQIQESVERFGIEWELRDPNLIVAKGAALFGYKCRLEQMIKIAIAGETGQSPEDVDLNAAGEDAVEKAQKEVSHSEGLALPDMKRLVDKKVINVSSKSFGVIAIDPRTDTERVTNLIQKDDQVPTEYTSTFGTYDEGQEGVDLRLMESQIITASDDTVDPELCDQIGSAQLKFKRALPKGSPVEVTFRLGGDGRLFMEAKDTTTGEEFQADYETESIMSGEQVEEARRQALEMTVS